MTMINLTEEETKEFKELKKVRNVSGFFLPNEEIRWNYLFDKTTGRFFAYMKKHELVNKQIEEN